MTAVDPTSWDAFVEASDPGSYLQLPAWASVKAVNGWTAHRIEGAPGGPGGAIGAQILVRRPSPMPWGFAYAPRGPVASDWTPDAIAAFTAAVRERLPAEAGRISHLRIDPEIEADGPLDPNGALRQALREAGWRPAPPIQPNATRVDRSPSGRGGALRRPSQEVAPVRQQGTHRGHHRGRRGW